MAEQKHEIGDIVGDLEVVAVSYQEDADGNKVNFTYQFKTVEDMQAQRELEAQLAAELKAQEAN
jgi:hypothetical protein